MLKKPVSLVAGSSGLVGSLILRNLSNMPGSIISLVRKKKNNYKNITEKIINFDDTP